LFIRLPNCLTMDYLKAKQRTINPEEKTKFFLTFFFRVSMFTCHSRELLFKLIVDTRESSLWMVSRKN
jgi:hypothetical protein